MRKLLVVLFAMLANLGMHAQIEHGIEMHMWLQDKPVSVYLPHNYYSSPRLFPVLYLLHGTGGDELSWFNDGEIVQTLDMLISNGTIREMVVVMPYVSPEMDGTYEIFFDKLRKMIEANFKVSRLKQYHAIAGLSMGGFYAMHISHYYPHEFDYVGLFSPIYTTKKMEIFKKAREFLFGVDQMTPRVYQHVESDLKKQFTFGPKLYYIAIGKHDFLYNQNVLYRQYLDEMGYKYTYVETGGGHEWKNWREYIKDFLPRLFQKYSGESELETTDYVYEVKEE